MSSSRPASDAPGTTAKWWVLAVVVAGTFMLLLDTTIVNVAIPSIQRNLGATYGAIEWVVSGYALAFGLVLIPAGRIGDRFGHRRLFILALGGFTITSLLCGTSTSPQELVAWRIVQGGMAGILNPQILAMVQVSFAPAERGKAFAFYGATAGAATALGPLLGGILVSADIHGLGWRPIFLLNVPIGVVALVAGSRLLPRSRGAGGGIDGAGIALVALSLMLILYPLIDGRSAGWPVWSFVALGLSLPVLGSFIAWQGRRVSAARVPLVDIRLFRFRAFAAGTSLGLTYFAGFTSVFFSLSLWLQLGLGRSALETGLTILPFAVGSLVGSALSDIASRRLGADCLKVGTSMVAIGLGTTLAAIYAAGDTVPGLLLLPSLAFAGIGSGLTIAPNTNAVLARVPLASAGAAGGVLSTAQRVGTALGVAIVGVLLFGALAQGAPSAAAARAVPLNHELIGQGLSSPARRHILQTFGTCFDRRAGSADPSIAPRGCPGQSQSPSPLSATLEHAGRLALAQDFTSATVISMWFNVGAVVLAFLLAFLFPRGRGARRAASPGGEASAQGA
ncbi:MAG: MFS transporter [Acidimicrobiales bacterium]